MSLPQYNDGYNHFDAAVLEAGILDGRRESGLNICHEICDRWAVDPQKVALSRGKSSLWKSCRKHPAARSNALCCATGPKRKSPYEDYL